MLVVFAHPGPHSFGSALAGCAVAHLRRAGHEVDLVDLYAEGFEPRVSAAELTGAALPGSRTDVARHEERLRDAEALVLVYPTWWGGQPAMLKGWFERVLPERPRATRRSQPRSGRGPSLRHIRRLVVVTTYGSSRWVNLLEGEPGRRTVRAGLRVRLHPLARTTWLSCYRMDTATAEDRRHFLDRVARAMERV